MILSFVKHCHGNKKVMKFFGQSITWRNEIIYPSF